MNSMMAARSTWRWSLVAAGPGREQHQQGAQALAAAVDDVVAQLVDERHGGLQTLPDTVVDRIHVVGDKCAYLVEIHGAGMRGAAGNCAC
jgi:hypothetical protein